MPLTKHRALCPYCARLAIRERTWTDKSLTHAAFVCPSGHAWQAKWQTPKEVV